MMNSLNLQTLEVLAALVGMVVWVVVGVVNKEVDLRCQALATQATREGIHYGRN